MPVRLTLANEIRNIEEQTGTVLTAARLAVEQAVTLIDDCPRFGDGLARAAHMVLTEAEEIYEGDHNRRIRELRTR